MENFRTRFVWTWTLPSEQYTMCTVKTVSVWFMQPATCSSSVFTKFFELNKVKLIRKWPLLKNQHPSTSKRFSRCLESYGHKQACQKCVVFIKSKQLQEVEAGGLRWCIISAVVIRYMYSLFAFSVVFFTFTCSFLMALALDALERSSVVYRMLL